MKKLLLSIACALGLTCTMNAQSIYLMGSGNGLSWESFPGMEVKPSADGSYSFTIENLQGFKMSTAQASGWDDFNAQAFGYSGTFGDAVFTTAGQTVSLAPWGENQDMPYAGSYTININSARSSMTVKANFTKPTAAPEVFIRGAMNSWGSPATYKFVNQSWDGTKGVWTWTGTINAGQEFKIADAGWGNINYSTNGAISTFNSPVNLTYNQQNSKFNETFTGTITLNVTNYTGHQATATFSTGGDITPTFPDELYIIGTINGDAWAPSNVTPMTNEGDGMYYIENLVLGEYDGSCGFAITGGGSTWEEVNSLRYGPSVTDTPAIVDGENTDISSGDLSWTIPAGTYNMQFDLNEPSLYIEKVSSTDPDQPIPGTPAKVYVVGAGDGLTWDLPGKEFTGENGVVSFTVENLGKFKASTVSTTSWDTYNANAYATGNATFGEAVYPDGQTLPMQVWGEDQLLPYAGTYTITLDFNKMEMTAKSLSGPSTEAPVIYVMGAMNNWTAADTWKFTNKSWDSATGTGEWTIECTINAGTEFKIADANWSDVDFGGAQGIAANTWTDLYYNDQTNLTLAQSFNGTITFKVTAKKSTATIYFAQEGEIKDPENFYVIGTLAEGAWNPSIGVQMTGNGEGVYTANEVTLVESEGSCGFAIVANLGNTDEDWSTVNALRFGPSVTDTPATVGENTEIASGDLSWSLEPGTYKMVFDYKNLTLTISEAQGNGVEGIETENGEAVYYNLQGVRVQNPDKGIYIRVTNGKAEKVMRN